MPLIKSSHTYFTIWYEMILVRITHLLAVISWKVLVKRNSQQFSLIILQLVLVATSLVLIIWCNTENAKSHSFLSDASPRKVINEISLSSLNHYSSCDQFCLETCSIVPQEQKFKPFVLVRIVIVANPPH